MSSSTDFLSKFNSLDDKAKEVIMNMIDLLIPSKRIKSPKIRWTDRRLDRNTEEIIEKAIVNHKKGDFSAYKPISEIIHDI